MDTLSEDSSIIQDSVSKVLVEEGYVATTIGEDRYLIKLLPAMQGVSLAKRLLKTVVPIIGLWADSEKNNGLVMPEDDNLFAEMAMMFINRLDDLGVEEVIAALFAGLKVNGEEVSFDNHFRANYSNMAILLEEAFRENFGSFFGDYLKAKGINLQEGLEALRTLTKQKPDQQENQPE